MHTPANPVKPHRPRRLLGRIPIPTGKLECIYYLATVISILGPALGLEMRDFGAVTVAIFVACVLRLQPLAKSVFAPFALLSACVISLLPIQIIVHRESILGESVLQLHLFAYESDDRAITLPEAGIFISVSPRDVRDLRDHNSVRRLHCRRRR